MGGLLPRRPKSINEVELSQVQWYPDAKIFVSWNEMNQPEGGRHVITNFSKAVFVSFDSTGPE